MLAKKTAKNQVTLPKEIADRFPDTVYFDVRVEGRKITLRPVRIETEGEEQGLGRIREKMRQLGVTEKDVTAAIRWARKEG
jgi:bifunctional DNA-binding transcriptional regulator/antitoxin component of YhaV-PrlF toxin-antitoxin module